MTAPSWMKTAEGGVRFVYQVFGIILAGLVINGMVIASVKWIWTQDANSSKITNLEYKTQQLVSTDSMLFMRIRAREDWEWKKNFSDSVSMLEIKTSLTDIKSALGIKPRTAFKQQKY